MGEITEDRDPVNYFLFYLNQLSILEQWLYLNEKLSLKYSIYILLYKYSIIFYNVHKTSVIASHLL